jgi:hypothetical protein
MLGIRCLGLLLFEKARIRSKLALINNMLMLVCNGIFFVVAIMLDIMQSFLIFF